MNSAASTPCAEDSSARRAARWRAAASLAASAGIFFSSGPAAADGFSSQVLSVLLIRRLDDLAICS
ncbi:MAG: hypothetical protein ACO4CZ_19530, partial [Planctomycetota bacterium]